MAKFKLTYQLEVAPSEGELSDVVKVIHWQYAIVDGEYGTSVYGAEGLQSPEGDFIPFDELTDANVQSWLSSSLDFGKLEEGLVEQLEQIKNPKTVMKELTSND